jgi:hypothetical protein
MRHSIHLQFDISVNALDIRALYSLKLELDRPAVSALDVRSRKLSNSLNGQSWDG